MLAFSLKEAITTLLCYACSIVICEPLLPCVNRLLTVYKTFKCIIHKPCHGLLFLVVCLEVDKFKKRLHYM